MTGVYAIIHRRTGMRYVGSALGIESRWLDHKRALTSKKHHSVKLQELWDSEGHDQFEFKVLEICEPEQRIVIEQRFIDEALRENKLLNTSLSASGGGMTKEIADAIYRGIDPDKRLSSIAPAMRSSSDIITSFNKGNREGSILEVLLDIRGLMALFGTTSIPEKESRKK